jgi:hypothetical protein
MSIHAQSHENLKIACAMAFDGDMQLVLYDNSAHNREPEAVCKISLGSVRILRNPLPDWAQPAVYGSDGDWIWNRPT